ncbi:hypothetical protein HPP92_024127 [Vanilla planifolia]|uniref:Uncharacterized protein n=1 Tax=Vanilla planifolia TaxID=51239 RepID=A0A835UB17_VANPL|nr:hypothetical protein HPP92_024127 [Vanilla planifolia]
MKNLPLIAPNASPSSSRRLQETQVVRRNPRHFQEGTTPTQAKAAWWIKAKPQRTRQIFPEPKAFNDPPVFPLFRSGTIASLVSEGHSNTLNSEVFAISSVNKAARGGGFK